MREGVNWIALVNAALLIAYSWLYQVSASVISFAALYLFGAAFALYFLKYSRFLGRDARFSSLQALFLVFLGPAGSISLLLLIGLYRLYSLRCRTVEQLLDDILPKGVKKGDTLYERILYGLDRFNSEKSLYPFQDIMLYGSELQKRQALEKMVRYYNPRFSKALHIGLEDPFNSVRVLAASAMTALEKDYYETFQKKEADALSNPDDAGKLRAYASFCEDYADSGIIEDERQFNMYEKAFQARKTLLKMEAKKEEGTLSSGRILYKMGKYEEAEPYLKQACKSGKKEAPEWLFPMLFKLGKWGELREYADLLSNYDGVQLDSELIELWKRGIAS